MKTIIVSILLVMGLFLILVSSSGCDKLVAWNATPEAKVTPPAPEPVENRSAPPVQALPTCVAEWKCLNASARAYQYENCSLSKDEECTGCSDGVCTPVPAPAEEINETEPEEIPIDNGVGVLDINEVESQIFKGVNYTIHIYYLEEDRVKIELNGKRSNWLAEEQNYTTSDNSTTVVIKEILFQPYSHGKKEIVYELI